MLEQNGPKIKEIFMRSSRAVNATWNSQGLMNWALSASAFPNLGLYELTKGLTQEQSNSRGTLTFLTSLSSDSVNRTKTEH